MEKKQTQPERTNSKPSLPILSRPWPTGGAVAQCSDSLTRYAVSFSVTIHLNKAGVPPSPLAASQRLHQHLLWLDHIIIPSAASLARSVTAFICIHNTTGPLSRQRYYQGLQPVRATASSLRRRRRRLTRTKRHFPHDVLRCATGLDTWVRHGPLGVQSLVRND